MKNKSAVNTKLIQIFLYNLKMSVLFIKLKVAFGSY